LRAGNQLLGCAQRILELPRYLKLTNRIQDERLFLGALIGVTPYQCKRYLKLTNRIQDERLFLGALIGVTPYQCNHK